MNTIRTTAEKSLIEEDADLTSVLIDIHDLMIPESTEDNVLGQGGFGKVLRGKYRGHDVAIKQMRADVEDEELHENLSRFRIECLFMKELKHENIVMLIGAVWSEAVICCVMEYVSGGSLKDVIDQKMNLTWTGEKLDYCIGICRGMVIPPQVHLLRRRNRKLQRGRDPPRFKARERAPDRSAGGEKRRLW